MSVEGAQVYVVMGSYGEWSARREFVIGVVTDEDEAKALVLDYSAKSRVQRLWWEAVRRRAAANGLTPGSVQRAKAALGPEPERMDGDCFWYVPVVIGEMRPDGWKVDEEAT